MERSVSEGRRLYRDVLNEVLKRIRPSAEERERTLRFAERLVCILKNRLKESGIEADVELQGSIAKDTWLAGEKDIDIFILLPRTYSREIFGKVLNVVKSVVGEDWKEAYAEHPYIQAKIGDFTVDCVPCFRVSKASDVSSSVDRTPLHTRYVREKLNGELKNQVRMLKRFMKGIGTYGAEIKIGGFSGYLCELLTLYYGSFMNVLEAASSWRRGEIIDIEGYYQGNEEKVLELFKDSPLIVIDPTDKSRNVASSVRECKLSEFIAASRMFLRKPSITYFYPREIRPLSLKNLKNNLQKRGTSLLIIKFNALDVVSDVLWGQLYKSLKAVSELLASHDFRILRQDVWSDEKEFCLFIFEMESLSLPPMKKHLGPPINKVSDCERFLSKHLGSRNLISGPKIEDGRWVVWIRRPYVNVVDLLREKLKDGGRKIGVASMISREIAKSIEILLNEDIFVFYSSNRRFAEFLTNYLDGRPLWLRE